MHLDGALARAVAKHPDGPEGGGDYAAGWRRRHAEITLVW